MRNVNLKKLRIFVFSTLFLPAVAADEEGGQIADTFISEIAEFITFIFDMIKEYLIEPPLRIIRDFFSGLAVSIYSVGVGMFSGASGAMDHAWGLLESWLSRYPVIGPFAPWIASVVIWGVVVICFWFVLDVLFDIAEINEELDGSEED